MNSLEGHRRPSFTSGSLVIGDTPVICLEQGEFVLRCTSDLRRAFGWQTSPTSFETRLRKVAQLLNAGRHFEALFVANLIDWHEPKQLGKANFDQSQPRDYRGWWTKEVQRTGTEKPVQEVQYRGFFHDVVVDDFLRGLSAGGSTALKNVNILGLNGILAIPDGASRPEGWTKPYFIEIKTGNDPDFTPNQKQVYPLICVGGHATSTDPRISRLGLTPGVPFPPLDIMLVHTYGPGMPLRIDSYCDEFVFGRSPHAP